MPDNQNSDARRRRRRRRGPNSGSDDRGPQRQNSNAKPSGLSKFLSIISFGLLGGKSKSKPATRPQSAPPVRFEGEGRSPRDGNRPPRDRGDRENRPPREPRAPREPRREEEQMEVTTERLYVGNLSYDATESDLFELFSGVGKVQNAEVVVNSRTQRSKGFAFITMASVEEAKRAVAELRGKDFMGRALQVSGAKPPQHDRDESEGRSSQESGEHAEAAAEESATA